MLDISLEWLLKFITEVYDQLPDELSVQSASTGRQLHLLRLEAEADELWSFVGSKANKQWVWLAFDPHQVGAGLLRRRPQPEKRAPAVAENSARLP